MGVKISALASAVSALSGAERLPFLQGGATKYGTPADLKAYTDAFTQVGTGAATGRTKNDKALESVTIDDYRDTTGTETDDTLAIQRAADAAYASGKKRVQGVPGNIYTVKSTQRQVSIYDLHDVTTSDYVKALDTDPSHTIANGWHDPRTGVLRDGYGFPQGDATSDSFDQGYWCGVLFPEGVEIHNATIQPLDTDSHAEKCGHLFMWGDPTSATRHQGGGAKHCRFVSTRVILNTFGIGCLYFQSVDNPVNDFNEFICGTASSTVGRYKIYPSKCHDCYGRPSVGNYHFQTTTAYIYEYCKDTGGKGHIFVDCYNDVDMDKACFGMEWTGIVVRNRTQATVTDFYSEFNGVDGLKLQTTMNKVGNAVLMDGKGGLAATFVAGLTGLAAGGGAEPYASYFCMKNVEVSIVADDVYRTVFQIGDDWANVAHNGFFGASNVRGSISGRNWYNSNPAAPGGNDAAVVINECDNFNLHVDGDVIGSYGVYLQTSLETAYTGAGTYSITKGTLSGKVRGGRYSGVSARYIDSLKYDDFNVIGCGFAGGPAAVIYQNLELRPANIRGSLHINNDGSAATVGIDYKCKTWTAGQWQVVHDALTVVGFTTAITLTAAAGYTPPVTAAPIIHLAAKLENPGTYFTDAGAMTFAGAPSISPRFVGEIAFNSTSKQHYNASAIGATTDWKAINAGLDISAMSYRFYDKTDCANISTTSEGFRHVSSGAGAAWTVRPGQVGHHGILRAVIGTLAANTGYVGCATTNCLMLGTDSARWESVTSIVALSDGTNTYTLRDGFQNATSGIPTDGAFFRYTHSVNGGKWECVCRKAGTETAVDSGITAVITTWRHRRVVVDATGAYFYVDGTLVATITTNVPNTVALSYLLTWTRTVGTASIGILDVDACEVEIVLASAR